MIINIFTEDIIIIITILILVIVISLVAHLMISVFDQYLRRQIRERQGGSAMYYKQYDRELVCLHQVHIYESHNDYDGDGDDDDESDDGAECDYGGDGDAQFCLEEKTP